MSSVNTDAPPKTTVGKTTSRIPDNLLDSNVISTPRSAYVPSRVSFEEKCNHSAIAGRGTALSLLSSKGRSVYDDSIRSHDRTGER